MNLRNLSLHAADNSGMRVRYLVKQNRPCTPIAIVSLQMRVRKQFGGKAFSALLLSLGLGLMGCGSENPPPGMPPATSNNPAGTVYGTVLMGSPVRGVVVTAYQVDLGTGLRQDRIAASEPTGVDGKFSLVLGGATGPVVLEARGDSAAYSELSSGEVVTMGSDLVLRAAYRNPHMTGTSAFIYMGDALPQPGIVIGPWSELAYTHAEARRSLGQSSDFPSAIERAYALFKEHLEYWFDTVVPADIGNAAPAGMQGTSGVTTEQIHAAVLLRGLSSYAERTGPQAKTATLLSRLRTDLEQDGVFDGKSAPINPIEFGNCAALCKLSGRTLRTDFANSMVYYLNSEKNHSGSSAETFRSLLTRISLRQSELFASDDVPVMFDGEAPEIKVIPSQVVSDTELGWRVGLTPEPGDGDSLIPYVIRQPKRIRTDVLTETTFEARPHIVVNATTYAPLGGEFSLLTADPRIPVWKVEAASPEPFTIEARLLRNQQEVKGWFELGTKPEIGLRKGPRYEIWLTDRLSKAVAELDGDFELQVRTRDALLNTTTKRLYWSQTVTAPPVRVVPAACDPCSDIHCPTYYTMSGYWWGKDHCPAAKSAENNMEQLLEGSGPSGGMITISNVRIDNPNRIPVRVRFTYDRTALSTYLVYVERICPTTVNLPNCMWLTATSGASAIPSRRDNVPIAVQPIVQLWKGSATSHMGWPAPSPTVPCPDCAPNEFILPVGFYASVVLRTAAFSSLLSDDYKSRSGPVPVTTDVGEISYYGNSFDGLASYSISLIGAVKAQARAHLTLSVRPDNKDASVNNATGPQLTIPQFLGYNRANYHDIDWHWNWMDVLAPHYVKENTCKYMPTLCGWPGSGANWSWDPWIFPPRIYN